jgi:hypothetical protein
MAVRDGFMILLPTYPRVYRWCGIMQLYAVRASSPLLRSRSILGRSHTSTAVTSLMKWTAEPFGGGLSVGWLLAAKALSKRRKESH